MTSNAQTFTLEKKRAAWLSLIVGAGMLIAKMGAYLLTGSTAIFSDAIESVVHVAATTMALVSIYVSSKPADESHLYGHGNIEYFSAGVEGFLIVLAAVTIIYTSVHGLIYGVTTKQLDLGTTIIGAAGLINLFLGFYLIKKGNKTNSLTLVADGKHVLTDSYTSIGVVIGLVLVLVTDFFILDPIIAILVAVNILFTGYKLMRESVGGLMNETDKNILNKIVAMLNNTKREFWIDIHHLRFLKSGERVFVDFHIILPYYFSIKQSHLEEQYIESELMKIFPNSGVRLHADYCSNDICKYCSYQTCSERKSERTIFFDWDSKRMLGEPIYKEMQ